jgi:ABC-type amino acid transport substrate-binding protein
MRMLVRTIAALICAVGTASAAERYSCDIPDHFLFDNNELKRVAAVTKSERKLTIAVVGTGSSALAGPNGPASAYPARLETVLKHRLPGVEVKVIPLVRSRQTAEDMAKGMEKIVADEKPDLVIWQSGTIDAMRGIDPEEFRSALDEGIEVLQKGGADVILMNMQYSPRTDLVVALGPYADTMRVVAQQREVPLFDRLSLMRHWSDTGAFDLYATGKDNVLATQVHDCIGHGMAAMILDAAHLRGNGSKTAQ